MRVGWVLGLLVSALSWGAVPDRFNVLDPETLQRLGLEATPEFSFARPWDGARATSAVEIDVLLKVGDVLPGTGGAVIVDLDPPVVNGDDEVGIQGELDSGAHFVWFDGVVVFLDSAVSPASLLGGESSMGIGAAGEFVYSPFVDGNDGLWSDAGLLAVEGSQAPGRPVGESFTFLSRPTMDDSGRAYWIAGVDSGGDGFTEGRVLYSSPDGTSAAASPIFGTGDVVDGGVLAGDGDPPNPAWGVGFLYDISHDGAHHVHLLQADNVYLYLDGEFVLTQAGPWHEFKRLAINNAGELLVSADSNVNPDPFDPTDEVVAYGVSPNPPAVQVREGDTLGGIALETPGNVLGLGVSDTGCGAQLWSVDGGVKHLFLGRASYLATSSDRVLSTGNELDVDGNGTPDATLMDFVTSSAAMAVDGENVAYVTVELDFGSGTVEAVIAVPDADGACDLIFMDGFESGDTAAWDSAGRIGEQTPFGNGESLP